MLVRINVYKKCFTGKLNGEDDCRIVLKQSKDHVLINLDAICSITVFEIDDDEYALLKMMDRTEYIIKNYDLSCLLQSGKIKSA